MLLAVEATGNVNGEIELGVVIALAPGPAGLYEVYEEVALPPAGGTVGKLFDEPGMASMLLPDWLRLRLFGLNERYPLPAAVDGVVFL